MTAEDMTGNEDALQRMFEAANKGEWAEAAAAYKDLHVIVDDQLEAGEGEEKEEPPKGKRPLAAIVIGGPPKK